MLQTEHLQQMPKGKARAIKRETVEVVTVLIADYNSIYLIYSM